jgi:uncharacterized protein (TIGR00369 family)
MALKGHKMEFDKIKDALNASPYYQHLRIKLVHFSERGSEMTMETGESHNSVYGRVHGGAIASLADSACSLALVTVIEANEFIATQSLNVNYILPVEEGILKARGWVVHRGRHTAILEADIFDNVGRKVAHAHTVHVIRALPEEEEGGTFIDKVRKSRGKK